MDKYLGKRLDGRYEIREIIGNGGMANVYKAYDRMDDRFVALKILKDQYADNEEFSRRFRNESKAISVLSHENIVRILDVSFGNNIQYIVMEYIDGITLKQYMEQAKVLNWKEAVHFTLQILKALQHAHENGVVHRDIKPENIMLLEDGTIKVMDFGIASFARDERRVNSKTAIGSVHYISPEQASGASTDERTDIYSVGVMLYEMLTGELPFDGNNPEQVAVMHMQAKAKRPRELNDTIPEGLEEIIIRAMQKNASMRYQTAAEMIRDIDEFKRNPSIVFEYKYFSDEGTTKFFNAVNAGKNSMTFSSDGFGDDDEEALSEKTKKSKTIPILAGVAAAFVLVAVLIISIIVFINNGKKKDIETPNLIGLNYEEIKGDPAYSNIVLKAEMEYSDKDAGTIIDQSPVAGRLIKEGSVVEITVSRGPKEIDIPDVYNMTQADAEAAFADLGLQYTIQKAYDLTVAYGCVIKTDPARNTQVPSDTVVTIFVSMGKPSEMTIVPDVMGQTESEARKLLEKAGLKVNVVKVDTTENAGKVIDQSKASGTSVAEGTTITIKVSTGKASPSSVKFSVPIPSGATGDYYFKVSMDGAIKETKLVNVDSISSYEFTLSSSSSDSTVAVQVAKKGSSTYSLYIKYGVNFVSGTKFVMEGPYKSLLLTPSSSAPVSSSPGYSSAPVSSTIETGEEEQ